MDKLDPWPSRTREERGVTMRASDRRFPLWLIVGLFLFIVLM